MIKTITLNCDTCKTDFERRPSDHAAKLRNGAKNTFCSVICSNRFPTKDLGAAPVNSCRNCGDDFQRGHKNRNDKLIFCGTKCANVYNNFHARKPENYTCADCGKEKNSKSKLCADCKGTRVSPRKRFNNLKDTTLGQLRVQYSVSQYHAKIRGDARAAYKDSKRPHVCAICSYEKHVDICHIIDLKAFPDTTTVKEANSPDNLVALCKNHHWEFDHDTLSEEDTDELSKSMSSQTSIN